MLALIQIRARHVVLLFCAALSAISVAQDAVREDELKVAFVYTFTKFVEWPNISLPGQDVPFVIGLFADDPLFRTFQTALANKKAQGRPIRVRKLSSNSEAIHCQMLFFIESESRRMAQIYEAIKDSPILTVGESDQFFAAGGMFNLFLEDKQLRFQVNTPVSERARLSISSKLLRLARRAKG